MKNTHWNYCGDKFTDTASPYTCSTCNLITYENPVPVAVVLVPSTSGGVYLIKRGIEPGLGEWALPGGFIELNETWQEAGCRELEEETGLTISPDKITFVQALSIKEKGLLILFMKTDPVDDAVLKHLPLSEEATEGRIVFDAETLAFETHTKILADFLNTH